VSLISCNAAEADIAVNPLSCALDTTSTGIARGFGPRLVRQIAPFQDAEIERDEPQALLAPVLGVASIHQIKSHPRSGYVAVMDFAMRQSDAWIVHPEDRGWMSVM
jgi:hypothetical protein